MRKLSECVLMNVVIYVILVVILSVCEAGFATEASIKLVDASRAQLITEVDAVYRSNSYHSEDKSQVFSESGSVTQSVLQELYEPSIKAFVVVPLSTVQFATNECIRSSNHSFKFQITEDSCTGAYIQHFKDRECKDLVHLSTVEPLIQKGQDTDGYFRKLSCTVKPQPATQGVVVAEFRRDATHTGSVVQSVTIPLDACLSAGPQLSFAYSCRGYPMLNKFLNPNCHGGARGTEYVNTTYQTALEPENSGFSTVGAPLYVSVHCKASQ